MQAKTINISFPQGLLEKINQVAKEEYRSRSELFKEAVLCYLQTKNNWKVLQRDISLKAEKMGIKNEDQIEEMIDSLRE